MLINSPNISSMNSIMYRLTNRPVMYIMSNRVVLLRDCRIETAL